MRLLKLLIRRDYRMAEGGQCMPQIIVPDRGHGFIQRLLLAVRQGPHGVLHGFGARGNGPLMQNQTRNGRKSVVGIDPVDDQRGQMLKFEGKGPVGFDMKGRIAAFISWENQLFRATLGGQLHTDNRRPPGHNLAHGKPSAAEYRV